MLVSYIISLFLLKYLYLIEFFIEINYQNQIKIIR